MTPWDQAIAFVRKHEADAFVDYPDDPGCVEDWGVPLRSLRGARNPLSGTDQDDDVDGEELRGCTWEQAAEIYRVEFWDRLGLVSLPTDVAIKTFDLAVLCGPRQAVRFRKSVV